MNLYKYEKTEGARSEGSKGTLGGVRQEEAVLKKVNPARAYCIECGVKKKPR